MQLIECHIENFGKLRNYDIKFTDGVNEILDENGWGKSTLAAFIKVMLYGFDDEKKRTGEKERKKYMPWQGGEYGGRLTIQTKEGAYIICRSFGKTEKNDELKILDAGTQTETDVFKKGGASAHIGERLFCVDRDTFFNTMYISQADRRTQVTNDIHARIGSSEQILQDIGGYGKVEERIKNAVNRATPNRKGGFLKDIQNKISEMERTQQKRETLEETARERQEQIRTHKEQKMRLQGNVRQLQEQKNQISIYNELSAKRNHYQEFVKEEQRRRSALEQARACFPGRLPNNEDCIRLSKLEEQLQKAAQQMENYRFTQEEEAQLGNLAQYFSGRLPSGETLAFYKKKSAKLQTLNLELARERLSEEEDKKLGDYQRIFGDHITEEEFDRKLDHCRTYTNLKQSLQEKRSALQAAAMMRGQYEYLHHPKSVIWQYPAGLIGILAGIILALFLDERFIGIIMLIAGICLCGCGLLAKIREKSPEPVHQEETMKEEQLKEELLEGEQRLRALLEDVHQFLAALNCDCEDSGMEGRLYELKTEYHSYKRLLSQKQMLQESGILEQAKSLYRELIDFLQPYALLQSYENQMNDKTITALDSALSRLERNAELYQQLRARSQRRDEAKTSFEQAAGEISDAFRELSMVPEKELREQIRGLEMNLHKYVQCRQEEQEAADRVSSYLKKENIEQLMNLTQPENMCSLEELDEKILTFEQQIEAETNEIDQYSRAYEQAAEEIDQLNADAEMLEEMKKQQQKVREQYDNLLIAQDFLDQAKTNLTKQYTDPFMTSLEKYYKIITDGEECHYSVDANLKVYLDVGSIPKELSALSMGYQDLSWLCMRLSFIDAMYQEDKPFLIMDDPLVNMDEKRIRGGRRLLKQLSARYQILYFTCHRSRSIADNSDRKQDIAVI